MIDTIGNESDYATAVAIQSDVKIVIGECTDIREHNNFAVPATMMMSANKEF